jgi:hypothetical protein
MLLHSRSARVRLRARGAAGLADSAALLERGLRRAGTLTFEALATSCLGVSAGTRCVLAAPIRSLRVAAGVSHTGAEELGWSAAGLAIGAAGPRAGAALRGIARRDAGAGPARDVGLEVGGGAWVRAGGRARIWASAPQAWCRRSPLLPRLAVGASFAADGVAAWIEREAPARAADENGRHDAGVALDWGVARAWIEAREQPLRAAVGVEVAARRWSVRVRVESHPVLGETVSLALDHASGAGLAASTRASRSCPP